MLYYILVYTKYSKHREDLNKYVVMVRQHFTQD